MDENLDRRREVVAMVEARGRAQPEPPLEMPGAFGELRGWFARFEAACESVDEGSVAEAGARMVAAAVELDRLRVRAAAARRFRQFRRNWSAIDAALEGYQEIHDSYVGALTAPIVPEVEAAATRGQDAINAATEAIDRLNDFDDAYERASDVDLSRDQAPTLAAAEAVASLGDSAEFLELDRRGASKFARIVGAEIPCPSGFGVRLELLDFAVEGTCEPTRFWPMTRRVYQLLAGGTTSLNALAADPDWRSDFVAVSREILDSSFEAAAVASTGTENRRRLIQSALRMAARHHERAIPPLLATLLTVDGRQSYASERKRDFNALLTKAEQRGHGELLLGFDPKLRDADAHGAYLVEPDGVRFTGTRGKLDYVTDDELVDLTLAGIESLVALHWGVLAALVVAGVDIDEFDEALAEDVVAEDKVKFVLLLNGWHDVDVEVAAGQVVARGRRDAESPMFLIPAIVAAVPEECERLTLVAEDETGAHTATGPVDPFLRASEQDDVTKGIVHMVALSSWTIDGVPIASRAHTHKLYAYRAVEALNPEVPASDAMRILRAALEASKELGLDELAAALTWALRLRREVATGVTPTRSVEEVVDGFGEWLYAELPELRISW